MRINLTGYTEKNSLLPKYLKYFLNNITIIKFSMAIKEFALTEKQDSIN